MSPSGETNFQSVSIYANNEMQLRSTFHFTFQLRGPEMEKNTIKSVGGKIAHALCLAEEVLSIIGNKKKHHTQSSVSLCKAAAR